MTVRYEAQGTMWASAGVGGWCFITLPAETATALRTVGGRLAPYGSMRVTAAIGDVVWKTSLFADRRSGAFLLPIKAEIRRWAGVSVGDAIAYAIEIDI